MDEQDKIDTIQQLWFCLQKGYTYAESKIHIEAFRQGKTTVKKVMMIDRRKND